MQRALLIQENNIRTDRTEEKKNTSSCCSVPCQQGVPGAGTDVLLCLSVPASECAGFGIWGY